MNQTFWVFHFTNGSSALWYMYVGPHKKIYFITFFVCSREDGVVKFLTKGDNNQVDDRGLYAQGQLWLEKKDVVGRAKG